MTVAGCMALAALSAVAVLDVGSRAAQAEPSVSPFAGSWSGTWAHVEDDLVGTFDWTISDAGRLTGRVYGTTTGSNGTVVGHVHADGDLNITGYVPNDVPGTGPTGVPCHGAVAIDGDGKLVVSATVTHSGGISFVAILERN
jgi:hypothetical protein